MISSQVTLLSGLKFPSFKVKALGWIIYKGSQRSCNKKFKKKKFVRVSQVNMTTVVHGTIAPNSLPLPIIHTFCCEFTFPATRGGVYFLASLAVSLVTWLHLANRVLMDMMEGKTWKTLMEVSLSPFSFHHHKENMTWVAFWSQKNKRLVEQRHLSYPTDSAETYSC